MSDMYRENAYLNELYDTALALMGHLDLQGLPECIVDKAGKLAGTQSGCLALLDEISGRYVLSVSKGFSPCHVGQVVTPGVGVVGQVMASGETCIANDYATCPYRDIETEDDVLTAVIGLPLKVRGSFVGIIGLGHNEPKEFSQQQVAILNRFADLAAIVLSNAKKHTALQQELAERRQTEQNLRQISYYDALTGLYNMTFFKQEMSRYEKVAPKSIAIILCDVDGLKLINDTLGHKQGDLLLSVAAKVIRASVRASDIVARIGGDEFAIMLPNAAVRQVEAIYSRIRKSVGAYNALHPELPLSLSVGFAIGGAGTSQAAIMPELLREADDNMYREKLQRSQESRSAMVSALLKALELRDFITEGHGDRMQEWGGALAASLNLSAHRADDIKLLAQFHDIGKVGISERLLFKPGRLTPEEHSEVQRHAEIGYRIALAVPDLIPIADYILKHHEWWDGNGYPIGLKGREIPLACRILAIVDAYDAMTSTRPYRRPLTSSTALAELRQLAGSQFDPELTDIFCQLVEGRRGDSV